MATGLVGGPELKRRLRAVGQVFKAMGKDWATETVHQMRPRVPERTGRLRKSFRVKNVTQKHATVFGHYTAFFVDAGPVPHVIKAKRSKSLVFKAGNRTIFARQVHHRGYGARPFRQRAAEEGLRKTASADVLIKAWTEAA